MATATGRKLVVFGSFLPRNIISSFKEDERPENDHIRWTNTEQLHLAWQSFYQSQERANFNEVKKELEEIEAKYCPILINLFDARIMPNKVTPTSLMWNGEILEIAKDRQNIEERKIEFFDALRSCLKKLCVVPNSTQMSPHVVLGRFPKNTPGTEISSLEQYPLPQAKFMLETLDIIEAIKDPQGLTYQELGQNII